MVQYSFCFLLAKVLKQYAIATFVDMIYLVVVAFVANFNVLWSTFITASLSTDPLYCCLLLLFVPSQVVLHDVAALLLATLYWHCPLQPSVLVPSPWSWYIPDLRKGYATGSPQQTCCLCPLPFCGALKYLYPCIFFLKLVINKKRWKFGIFSAT